MARSAREFKGFIDRVTASFIIGCLRSKGSVKNELGFSLNKLPNIFFSDLQELIKLIFAGH